MGLYIVIGLLFGTICSVLANGKGRSAFGWFVIGFFLPIIGLILILVLERPGDNHGGLVIPDGLEINPLPVTQVPSTTSSPPMVEELERLAALHQQGALTEAEFSAQKERLFSQNQT